INEVLEPLTAEFFVVIVVGHAASKVNSGWFLLFIFQNRDNRTKTHDAFDFSPFIRPVRRKIIPDLIYCVRCNCHRTSDVFFLIFRVGNQPYNFPGVKWRSCQLRLIGFGHWLWFFRPASGTAVTIVYRPATVTTWFNLTPLTSLSISQSLPCGGIGFDDFFPMLQLRMSLLRHVFGFGL